MRISRPIAVLIACGLLTGPAGAQSTVRQQGTVMPGHAARWIGNGAAGDAGTADGGRAGTTIEELNITNKGRGFCFDDLDKYAGAGRHRLCFEHDEDGNPVLNIYSEGGASPGNLTVKVNGQTFNTPIDPTVFLAPRNVYVSPTGNDNNSCLNLTHQCATMKRAYQAGTQSLLAPGTGLTINLAAGTYTETFAPNQFLTGANNANVLEPGQVTLFGTAGSSSTIINGGPYCGTIIGTQYAVIGLIGLTLNGNSNSCQSTVYAQLDSIINIYTDVKFGPASVEHIHVEDPGSSVQDWYGYEVIGDALIHITVGEGSYKCSVVGNYPHKFTGTRTFLGGYIAVEQNGRAIYNADCSFTGSFTGRRYLVYDNGVLATYASQSLTWIPGTGVGLGLSGGVYHGPTQVTFTGAIATDDNGTTRQALCNDILTFKCDNSNSWTPFLSFGGDSTGITYGSRPAYYYLFGKLVTATFDITLTSKGSVVGNASIGGLPYVAADNLTGSCTFGLVNNMASLTGSLIGYVPASNTIISLAEPTAAGSTVLSQANFNNGSRITGTCTYATD